MAHPRRTVALLTAAALAAGGVAPAVWARAVSAPHIVSEPDAPTSDVALVLGAGVNPDGSPSAYLTGRLEVALRLYQQGRVRVVLVSGDNGQSHYNEPEAMKRWLVGHGMPADKVVEDFAGFDTYDSCVRAKEIFGVTRLTLVTQGYHLPRAVATCRSVGIDATGVGDDTVRAPFPRTWYLGEAREVAGAWKMIYDLVSGRKPTLGPKEPSVEQALR